MISIKRHFTDLIGFVFIVKSTAKSPGRFKFTLYNDQDTDFNCSIYVNIMYIDGQPVLYVIDEATRF